MSKKEELGIAVVEEWRVVVVRCLFLKTPVVGIMSGGMDGKFEGDNLKLAGNGEEFSVSGEMDLDEQIQGDILLFLFIAIFLKTFYQLWYYM